MSKCIVLVSHPIRGPKGSAIRRADMAHLRAILEQIRRTERGVTATAPYLLYAEVMEEVSYARMCGDAGYFHNPEDELRVCGDLLMPAMCAEIERAHWRRVHIVTVSDYLRHDVARFLRTLRKAS